MCLLQAEKESMEQQLENLTAQLDSMKAKTVELAGHNSTLEKAVAFKDIEVANLQECSHVSQNPSALRFEMLQSWWKCQVR